MYLPEIGIQIKELRKQHNLTQKELAERLGVSKSVVSSYETGTHFPPYDILLKAARLFHVSTDYLLGLSGNCIIDADGLTETQIKAVMAIVDELREANKEPD